MPKTISDILQLKSDGEKIAVLTAYDASFTYHAEQAGVDILLVGDSLGMVLQGHSTTLQVTTDDMVYHTKMVSRLREQSLLIADMSYHSYTNKEEALKNATRLIDDGGADMVKLEGGEEILPVIEYLIKNDIEVCGHLGLLPQSVEELGGFKVQGREPEAANKILHDAQLLNQAGVEIIVLECIPRSLSAEISNTVDVVTIGIGAGANCDGQVLVLYDVLGITPGKRPRFSKDFLADLEGEISIQHALSEYVAAVKSGAFPSGEQSFN